MKEKLVIAFDSEGNALEIRRAATMRHARAVARDLYHDYGWSPRISICEEVDATTVGDDRKGGLPPMSP